MSETFQPDFTVTVTAPRLPPRPRAPAAPPPPPGAAAPATSEAALAGAEFVVDGAPHPGWTALRVTRGLDRLAGSFEAEYHDLNLPGRGDADPPFLVRASAVIEVSLDGRLALTGHAEIVRDRLDARGGFAFSAEGRSRTGDLVDSAALPPGVEFRGAALDAVARALCAPFGIEVVVEGDPGPPFAIVAAEPGETVLDVLRPLAAARGLLLTDDERGRLVIARPGAGGAMGAVLREQDALSIEVTEDASERFGETLVLAQRGGEASQRFTIPDAEGDEAEPPAPERRSVTTVEGRVRDAGVQRHRPRVLVAEQGLTPGEAVRRAEWERCQQRARGLRVAVECAGWDHGEDAWWPNKTVRVEVLRLRLADDLVVTSVEWRLDAGGRRVRLELTPIEALTPEPTRDPQPPSTGGTTGRFTLPDREGD